jgi:hypothetical protein
LPDFYAWPIFEGVIVRYMLFLSTSNFSQITDGDGELHGRHYLEVMLGHMIGAMVANKLINSSAPLHGRTR